LEGANYYCSGGGVSVGKTNCPAGTYNFVDGSRSSSDCWSCPRGYYCPTNAATPDDKIKICTQGYYCLAGVASPTICPVGFFCPEGTNVPIPCPAGYYGASTGLFVNTCTGPCTAGYYCDRVWYYPPIIHYDYYWGHTYDMTLCVNENWNYCYRGSTSPTQYDCPAGHYCDAGTVIPTACPIGTYSSTTRNT